MNAHDLRSLFGGRALAAAVTLLSLAVMGLGFAVGAARSTQDGQDAPDVSERAFEVYLPERLPIKVKLKSEKSFKNSENDNWMRELEVEVKNTGSKPIYYVQLSCRAPDIIISGGQYGFGMQYGRTALFYPETQVEPDDVPIMPGESVVLKVNGQNLKGHEYYRDVLKERRNPKRVVCQVSVIKFGDGTVLWGPDGEPPSPTAQEQILERSEAEKWRGRMPVESGAQNDRRAKRFIQSEQLMAARKPLAGLLVAAG